MGIVMTVQRGLPTVSSSSTSRRNSRRKSAMVEGATTRTLAKALLTLVHTIILMATVLSLFVNVGDYGNAILRPCLAFQVSGPRIPQRPATLQNTARIHPYQHLKEVRRNERTRHVVRRNLASLVDHVQPRQGDSGDEDNSDATNGNAYAENVRCIPFVVERVPEYANERLFQQISEMCIEAFFNDVGVEEEDTNKNKNRFLVNNKKMTTPWKAAQLAYLRTLQQGDLKSRRQRENQSNMMFVARQIIPIEDQYDTSYQHKPLILPELTEYVYNLPGFHDNNSYSTTSNENRISYVRGDVLGFVEVTKRDYALPTPQPQPAAPQPSSSTSGATATTQTQVRPVLTNLSVNYKARNSGVGSRLLEICEREVVQDWDMYEIILEVEDDNVRAKKFYEKRMYRTVFEDPTSRRYDLNGLWLREVRCKRNIMRKILNKPSMFQQQPQSSSAMENMQINFQNGFKAFQNFFTQQE